MLNIFRRTLLVFLAAWLACGAWAQAAETNRTALVIGNSDYRAGPLENPVNDAADMAEALRGLGFAVTHLENANQVEMEDAIRQFGKDLRQGGIGLFFFAGHGMQVNGRNYLIPLDSGIKAEKDIKYKAVDAGQVLDEMEAADNDMNVVILDACRNNPFARSFRSGDQGLARMDAPKGSLVAYSTSPGQVAADGKGRNSPYTAALLLHMKTPGIGLEKVFKEVRRDVDETTGGKQVPWESTSLTGDFYFIVGEEVASTDIPADHDDLAAERERLAAERARLEEEKKLLEEQKKLRAEREELEAERSRLMEDEKTRSEDVASLDTSKQQNDGPDEDLSRNTDTEVPGPLDTSNYKWFEDYDFNFRIQAPPDWQNSMSWEGSDKVYSFLSPDSSVLVSVRSFKVGAGVSVDQVIPVFEETLGNPTRLSLAPYTLNGLNGMLAGYRGYLDGVEAIIAVFYCIHMDNGYIVGSAIEPDKWGQGVAAADAITASFSVMR